jgi:hypothetical protein
MKKLFSLALLSTCYLFSNAQSGSLLVGGDIGYMSQKNEDNVYETKNSTFNFIPFVGYQFDKHWTVGARARFTKYKSVNPGQSEFTSTAFAAGPFLRYTKQLSDIFYLYGQAEGLFGNVKSKSTGGLIGETKTTTLNLFPAVFVNLKNNFGLNFNLGGLSYTKRKADSFQETGVDINFGRTASIGISKNFGLKKKSKMTLQ